MEVFRKWQPVGVVIVLLLVFQLVGPDALRYQTEQIHNTQYWRFFSGHWVHANWIHFALNIVGFILCFALTQVHWNVSQWLWRIAALSTAISTGFHFLQPQIGWYVGFSGVLFGLYVLAAFASLPYQRGMSLILLLCIALKTGLEQWSSVKINSSELIGVPVLVDAHLYGVVAAVLLLLIQRIWQQLQIKVKR